MRGVATALLLILIALACLTVARRFERERRLLAKLRQHQALEAGRALGVQHFDADERDTLADLASSGVVRAHGDAHYIDPVGLASFRRKRVRVALGGALGALALASGVAAVMLRG